MDGPFMIGLIPVAILIVVGVEYAKYKRDARRIHLCLHGKGATDISIVKVWSEGDRFHNVYDVIYTDIKHNVHVDRCIIRTSLFEDGAIYWKDDTSCAESLENVDKF